MDFNAQMRRREFLSAAMVGAASLAGIGLIADGPLEAKPVRKKKQDPHDRQTVPSDTVWHDVRQIGVQGRAFDDTEKYYDRLPAAAKGIVRPAVWNLSRDSAGMRVRFSANSPEIYIRYELSKPELAMPHMPATGVSGVDMYGLDQKRWRYIATHKPREQMNQAVLCDGLAAGARHYLLHLPLYNGVESMAIGLPKEAAASFTQVAPSKAKPVVFYGTSITQGGCAARPGMAFTNILARRLDRTVLNFGFSGNGWMETSVGKFLGEIDAAVFVIDCSANMSPALITAHCQPLVKLLRQMRGGQMPILLLDERPSPGNWIEPRAKAEHERKSQSLKQAYEDLLSSGDKQIYYHGDNLIGDDGEATVDNSHPTDLGQMRYADALEPVLQKLLR